jgi:hypothetical protein
MLPHRLHRLLRLCIVHWTLVIGHWSFAAAPAAAQHPRLFIDASELPAVRARAATPQGRRLVESIRWMRDEGDPFGLDSRKAFGNNAALYLATGDRAFADLARDEFLFYLSQTDVWANPSFKALSRASIARGAAVSYDLCHAAWAGQKVPASVRFRGKDHALPAELVGQDLNAVASRALLDSALALVKGGGKDWPGGNKPGNNWNAVRYGGALLALLACDEPAEQTKSAYETSLRHLRAYVQTAYSTHPDAGGWNPEGYGYTLYPAQFTYPAALALARLRDVRLADEVPTLRKNFASLFHGLLATPTRHPGPLLGQHPDFTDDNADWLGEGVANLAFAFAPPEQHAALRWMYRRTFGDLGDARYDTSSSGGLWGLLFLDFSAPEQNPAEVAAFGGRNFADHHHGFYSFRKNYGEPAGEDVLAQFMAKTVLTVGGHAAPDGLGFRLWGLGVPWTVGSGRTTDPAGQCLVFAGEPDDAEHSSQIHRVLDTYLRPAGGGYVVAKAQPFSDVGVRDHVRRFIADYRPETGAEAAWLVHDTSANGRIWRLNTAGVLADGRPYNVITHDDASATFTIENRFTGHRLVGRVLHPAKPVFRTGTFKRGSVMSVPLDLKGPGASCTENAWIDFASADGAFVVALTLHRGKQAAPASSISAPGSAGFQPASVTTAAPTREVRIGRAAYTLAADTVRVAGWERPRLAIASPAADSVFPGGAQAVSLSGNATTAGGKPVASVTVATPDGAATAATLSGDQWRASTAPLAPGRHTLTVRATDASGEFTEQTVSVRVTRSRPPVLALAAPAAGATLPADTAVTFRGSVTDPDGPLPAAVELFDADEKSVAKAAPAADGAFALVVPAARFAPGRHAFTLRTTDSTDDLSELGPLALVASRPFSDASPLGDLSAWTRSGEWRVVLEDEAGNLRYTILPSEGYKRRHALAYLRDRGIAGAFHLRLKVRLRTPESVFQVRFGRDAFVTLAGPAAGADAPPLFGFVASSGQQTIARLATPALPDLEWHDVELIRTTESWEIRRGGKSLVKVVLKADRSVEVTPVAALTWDSRNGPGGKRGGHVSRLWTAGGFGLGAPFADKSHLQLDDIVLTE